MAAGSIRYQWPFRVAAPAGMVPGGQEPAGRTLFCNDGRRWLTVVYEIIIEMNENGWRQWNII